MQARRPAGIVRGRFRSTPPVQHQVSPDTKRRRCLHRGPASLAGGRSGLSDDGVIRRRRRVLSLEDDLRTELRSTARVLLNNALLYITFLLLEFRKIRRLELLCTPDCGRGGKEVRNSNAEDQWPGQQPTQHGITHTMTPATPNTTFSDRQTDRWLLVSP